VTGTWIDFVSCMIYLIFLFLETSVSVLLLISAMELALALGKLVNEKLHNLHSVICSYCIACIFFFQDCAMHVSC
jgi:hypothetical protein